MPHRDSEESKRYQAEYRKKHREQLNEQERQRRVAKAAEIRAQRAAFREANREELRDKNKRWYWENKEYNQLKDRERYWNNPERRKYCIEGSKARHRANPNKLRAASLLKNYGMSLAEWDAILVKQCGRCAICSRAFAHASKEPHVDHNHATGAVRGFLCGNCNLALGLFMDSPKFVASALAYLTKHKKE